jgi:cobalt-zinc-cadmium resistance protein CzcA
MSRAIGSETQRPLAVVIVFGTMSACSLTLVLLPILYRYYATLVERFAVVRRGEEPAANRI